MILTLEDMLRTCVMQFNGDWESQLHLIKFMYKNTYHTSIGMSPDKPLDEKQCQTLLCWDEVGERSLIGSDYNNIHHYISQMLNYTSDRKK